MEECGFTVTFKWKIGQRAHPGS